MKVKLSCLKTIPKILIFIFLFFYPYEDMIFTYAVLKPAFLNLQHIMNIS